MKTLWIAKDIASEIGLLESSYKNEAVVIQIIVDNCVLKHTVTRLTHSINFSHTIFDLQFHLLWRPG